MPELSSLKCPSCGAPAAKGSGSCAFCGSSLVPSSIASGLLNSDAAKLLELARAARLQLEKNPDDALARLQLGVCCLKQGDGAAALAELERAQALAPLDSGVIYARAFVLALARSWTNPQVASLAKSALAIDPGMKEARGLLHLYTGRAWVENVGVDLRRASEQYAAAVEEYRKALDCHVPELSSYAYFFSGEAFDAVGDAANAAAMYQRAREKGCVEARLTVRLGVTLARLGRRDEAREELRSALEADPDNQAVRKVLAELS